MNLTREVRLDDIYFALKDPRIHLSQGGHLMVLPNAWGKKFDGASTGGYRGSLGASLAMGFGSISQVIKEIKTVHFSLLKKYLLNTIASGRTIARGLDLVEKRNGIP